MSSCLCLSPPPSHLPLVEVYNCGVGSSDCSQCWGREDQGHLCGWCENSCRPRDDCQPDRDVCPAPEIHKVKSLHSTFNLLLFLRFSVASSLSFCFAES